MDEGDKETIQEAMQDGTLNFIRRFYVAFFYITRLKMGFAVCANDVADHHASQDCLPVFSPIQETVWKNLHFEIARISHTGDCLDMVFGALGAHGRDVRLPT